MERLYTYLLAQSRLAGTIQIAVGTFIIVALSAHLRLLLLGWGTFNSVVSNAAFEAAVVALAWFIFLPLISARELTLAQANLVRRSWPALVKTNRPGTGVAATAVDRGQVRPPPLPDQAHDVDELARMLKDLELRLGVWREMRQQDRTAGAGGTSTIGDPAQHWVNLVMCYRKMYTRIASDRRAMRAEVRRLRASPRATELSYLLLAASELRVAALGAEKAAIERWFEGDEGIQKQRLRFAADWAEELARRAARSIEQEKARHGADQRKVADHALPTLRHLDGQAEPLTVPYTPGPYSRN
jgi:hypothetical protein